MAFNRIHVLKPVIKLSSPLVFGSVDCPDIPGLVQALSIQDMQGIKPYLGKHKGIQGHHNSCYMDSTLFSMFAFSEVFDSVFLKHPTAHDIEQYGTVQKVLQEGIVNPLRK